MAGRFSALVADVLDRIERFASELPFENVMKPCTCANVRRPGPCPRHGKLS